MPGTRRLPEEGPPSPEFVTVASFSQPVVAHLARSRLESEGIESFLADEHIVAIHSLYAGAVGGVKLRVRSDDRDRAAALLRAVQPRRSVRSAAFLSADPRAPRCKGCGALEYRTPRLGERALGLVSWLLGELAGISRERGQRCRRCGGRWAGPPRPHPTRSQSELEESS